MAIAEVGSGSQRATARRIGASASALTLAYPGNVAGGSLLVIGGSMFSSLGASISALTDTQTTSYSSILSTAGNLRTFIGYGLAPSSGANTDSLTPTNSSYIGYSIDEFSGVNATPLDVDGGSASGTSSAPSRAITTLVAGALIVAALYKSGTSTITPDAGWTQIGEEEDDNTYIGHSLIYQIAGAAGSYTASWTLSGSESWLVQVVSFAPATGASFIAAPNRLPRQAIVRASNY